MPQALHTACTGSGEVWEGLSPWRGEVGTEYIMPPELLYLFGGGNGKCRFPVKYKEEGNLYETPSRAGIKGRGLWAPWDVLRV